MYTLRIKNYFGVDILACQSEAYIVEIATCIFQCTLNDRKVDSQKNLVSALKMSRNILTPDIFSIGNQKD